MISFRCNGETVIKVLFFCSGLESLGVLMSLLDTGRCICSFLCFYLLRGFDS